MTSLILMPTMALAMAAGAIALKFYSDTQSLYFFALSLSLYTAGTAILADLMRTGQPLGTAIMVASLLQLIVVQLAASFLFGESFNGPAFAISLLAVALLMSPSRAA